MTLSLDLVNKCSLSSSCVPSARITHNPGTQVTHNQAGRKAEMWTRTHCERPNEGKGLGLFKAPRRRGWHYSFLGRAGRLHKEKQKAWGMLAHLRGQAGSFRDSEKWHHTQFPVPGLAARSGGTGSSWQMYWAHSLASDFFQGSLPRIESRLENLKKYIYISKNARSKTLGFFISALWFSFTCGLSCKNMQITMALWKVITLRLETIMITRMKCTSLT